MHTCSGARHAQPWGLAGPSNFIRNGPAVESRGMDAFCTSSAGGEGSSFPTSSMLSPLSVSWGGCQLSGPSSAFSIALSRHVCFLLIRKGRRCLPSVLASWRVGPGGSCRKRGAVGALSPGLGCSKPTVQLHTGQGKRQALESEPTWAWTPAKVQHVCRGRAARGMCRKRLSGSRHQDAPVLKPPPLSW